METKTKKRYPLIIPYKVKNYKNNFDTRLIMDYQYYADEEIGDVISFSEKINVSSSIVVNLHDSFYLNHAIDLTSEILSRDVYFRTWLNDFKARITSYQRGTYYILRKKYVDEMSNRYYYRYSIVERMSFKNKSVLSDQVQKLYSERVNPLVYRTLMVGSTRIDDSRGLGVDIVNEWDFRSHILKKIDYTLK